MKVCLVFLCSSGLEMLVGLVCLCVCLCLGGVVLIMVLVMILGVLMIFLD